MGSPKAPDAPETNYGKDISSFVDGMRTSLPGVLGTEGKFRGDFNKLNLEDVRGFLGGKGGAAALGGKYSKTAGKQISGLRTTDLKNMTQQTGLTRGLLQRLSPESARAVKFAQQDAIDAQRASKGLTGQESRTAQQFAREGAADRGRVMDNSAIASEVLNRDTILGQKRQEAAMATQNAYNLSNSFYSAPGLQALSRTPEAYGAGQSYLGMGLGAIGSAKPQLIDVGAGLNLGSVNRQNQFAQAQAQAQAKAQQQGALVSAGATVGGAAGGAYAGATYGSAAGPYGAIIGGVVGAAGGYFAGR